MDPGNLCMLGKLDLHTLNFASYNMRYKFIQDGSSSVACWYGSHGLQHTVIQKILSMVFYLSLRILQLSGARITLLSQDPVPDKQAKGWSLD